MTPDELTAAIAHIPGTTVTIDTNNMVTIDVGAGVPTLTHALSQIVSAEPVAAPDGSHAVRLAIQDTNKPDTGVIIYLTAGDVAFAPDPTEASAIVYPNGLLVDIAALPPGVSFTEMIRDLNTAPTNTNNYDELTTEILTMRCVLVRCPPSRARRQPSPPPNRRTHRPPQPMVIHTSWSLRHQGSCRGDRGWLVPSPRGKRCELVGRQPENQKR